MFTNQTPHFHLPQYLASDIHNELTDDNSAYSIIDEALYNHGHAISENAEAIAIVDDKIENDSTGIVPKVNTLTTHLEQTDEVVATHTTSIDNLNHDYSVMNTNVNALSNRVTSLDTTVSGYNSRISTVESGLTTANSKITQLQNVDTSFNQRITALENTPASGPSYDSSNEALVF